MTGGEQVGSLADEVAKLAGVLQGWAHEHGAKLGGVDDQIATGSAECRLCPVCRLIARIRESGPEASVHLAEAGLALLRAVRAFAEAGEARDRGQGGGVEHIDIDGDEEGGWD